MLQPEVTTETTLEPQPVDSVYTTTPQSSTPVIDTPLTPEEKELFDKPLPFSLGETKLTSTEEAYVRHLAELMRTHQQYSLTIIGHTCTTGGKLLNERISFERAETVKAVFVQQGVDAGRITTVGKDYQEPVASNETEEGRIKNRRVEIRVAP